MSFAYTLTPTSLNVLFKGRMRTINNTSPKFARAVEIIKEATRPIISPMDELNRSVALNELEEILDIRSFVARVTSGRVQIADDQVRLDGKPVTGYVVERTLALLKAGFDVTPMARFIDRLQSNPTADVREDMWKWLEVGNMPLTPDGKFVAFKKVRDDYLSDHDGKTLHVIGEYMSMPRNACDHNRNNTCSTGLHFCSYEYLGDYSGRSGRVLILEIDPADVVAIPTDYNLSKGRACGYTPVGEVPHEEAARFFDGSMPVYTASYVDAAGDTQSYTVAIDPATEDDDKSVITAIDPLDDTTEDEGYDETCDDCGYLEDDCECEHDPYADTDDEDEDDALPEAEQVTAVLTTDGGGEFILTGTWAEVEVDPAIADALTAKPVEWTDVTDQYRGYANVTAGSALHIREVLAGDQSWLTSAFLWRSSPQGWDHWNDRAYNHVPLTDADREWLTGLAFYIEARRKPVVSWVDAMRLG